MSAPTFRKWALESGSLDGDYSTDWIDINDVLDLGIELVWDGVPEGTFAVWVTNDKSRAGNAITLSSTPTASGAAGSWAINTVDVGFQFFKVVFTSTLVETFEVTTVADVAGNLNNKYFFFSEVGGLDYFVWFNINSAGVAPVIAGRTAIEVTGATNVSAATLASSIETAIEAVTDIAVSVASNVATCTQADPGHATAASAQDSGFTVTNAQAGSTLSGDVTAKGV